MTAPQDDEAPTTDRMIDDGLPAAITPEAVADDDDLAELVEAIVRADPNAREREFEISTLRAALEASLDSATWKHFTLLEDRVVARSDEIVALIARAFFNAGRTFPVAASTSAEKSP